MTVALSSGAGWGERWRGADSSRIGIIVALTEPEDSCARIEAISAHELGASGQVTSAEAPANESLHRLAMGATRAREWLLDLVFPPVCGNCGRVDHRFCRNCLRELNQVPLAVSRRAVEGLHDLRATGGHRDVLQKALQCFKYDGVTELSAPLAARLIRVLEEWNRPIDVIVPAPLFADREEERGYNQAALLSGHVAAETGHMLRADLLKRVRATKQQTSLNEQERRDNVKGAFEASPEVQGLSILLIDDVATTGSTLSECAKALNDEEAGRVYGLAVSHSLSGQWVRQEAYDEHQHSWRRD